MIQRGNIMKIWKIEQDTNKYQSICLKDKSIIPLTIAEQFRSGEELHSSWKPLEVEWFIDEENRKKMLVGDFPILLGPVPPVFSKKAIDVLNKLISPHIEILGLQGITNEYYLINVMEVINCLDYENSLIRRFKSSGRIKGIDRYAFNENLLEGIHIFRIPETLLIEIFVSEQFRQLYEDNQLEGLLFSKIDN
jgi:hypothetical protein